jgi:hypothetical protein
VPIPPPDPNLATEPLDPPDPELVTEPLDPPDPKLVTEPLDPPDPELLTGPLDPPDPEEPLPETLPPHASITNAITVLAPKGIPVPMPMKYARWR